eukprot:766408-Hanusia_phi.AAC.3
MPLNNENVLWYQYFWKDDGTSVSKCFAGSSNSTGLNSSLNVDQQYNTSGNYTCTGNQVFSQHMISTLDLPFSDVDNLANEDVGGSAYVANKSQWYWETIDSKDKFTYTPAGSVVRTLFSAYVCYPGPQNQPPKFVNPAYMKDQSLIASSRKFRKLPADYLIPAAETEKICYVNSTCVIELIAQDFLVGMDLCADPECHNFDNVYLSQDVVQIELVTDWTNWSGVSLATAHCESDPTRPCVWDNDCPSGDRCTGYRPDPSIQPYFGYCCDSNMHCLSGAEAGASSCTFDSDCPAGQQCVKPRCESNSDQNISGALKCYYTEYFSPGDAGKVLQRCFIARDPHGDKVWMGTPRLSSMYYPYVTDGLCDPRLNPTRHCNVNGYSMSGTIDVQNSSKTCSSLPVCFKIRVESNPPQFVYPTPLEPNSVDDQGNLIPDQTDIPACEGYPIDLVIQAEDPDVENSVRIFLHDFEIDTSVATTQDLQWMQTLPNSYNFDFFSNIPTPDFPPQCTGNPVNENFDGYDAHKVGINAQQESILPLDDSKVKSVVSGYAPKVHYLDVSNISVYYTLDLSRRNGITLRTTCETSKPFFNISFNDVSCREISLNMDQVICAYAYDDSRYQSKRWVGKRNPNSYKTPKNLRDHSDGDMSTYHCWRVALQAPPGFVTDCSTCGSSSTCSPRASSFNLIRNVLTANNYTMLHPKCVGVGQDFTYDFVAQDPNRQDLVQIFVLDNPGMPPGMTASPTYCIVRSPELHNPMCGATRIGDGLIVLQQNKTSRCSKAMLRLSWAPFLEQLNKTFFVCARAKDSSTACANKNKYATSRGWYGETACVELSVLPPVLKWTGYILALSDLIDVYVGCTVKVTIASSAGKPDGPLYVAKIGVLPHSKIAFTFTDPLVSNGQTSRVLEWTPSSNMQGTSHTLSFYTVDLFNISKPLWRNLTFRVQKCQYCIGNDILSMTQGLQYTDLDFIARYFDLEINWLHIWLMNGNVDATGNRIFDGNPNYFQFKIPEQTLANYVSNKNNSVILWLATKYKYGGDESLATIASSMRSSLRALLKLNPDVQNPYIPLMNQSSMLFDYVCILPCT